MSAKIGRPPSDDPRKKLVGVKLTEQELRLLEYYCKLNNISKSEVLKQGIQPIINPKSESE